MSYSAISELVGKTFSSVAKVEDGEDGGDELVFFGDESYKFFHYQDCCESVYIDDITGDLEDLEGTPILVAEERANAEGYKDRRDDERDESCTWTFYEFATIKGSVTVRWYGTSNGYYSESVNFKKIGDK